MIYVKPYYINHLRNNYALTEFKIINSVDLSKYQSIDYELRIAVYFNDYNPVKPTPANRFFINIYHDLQTSRQSITT